MNNENCLFGCVGYAYVPVQNLDEIYDAEKALCMASLFPELVININEYGKVCTKRGGVKFDG